MCKALGDEKVAQGKESCFPPSESSQPRLSVKQDCGRGTGAHRGHSSAGRPGVITTSSAPK